MAFYCTQCGAVMSGFTFLCPHCLTISIVQQNPFVGGSVPNKPSSMITPGECILPKSKYLDSKTISVEGTIKANFLYPHVRRETADDEFDRLMREERESPF